MEYELCVYQNKHKFGESVINRLIEEGWELYGENIKYGCTYFYKGEEPKKYLVN